MIEDAAHGCPTSLEGVRLISPSFDGVDRLMQAGVEQGVFPGAVLWISRGGREVFGRAYGWADLFSRRAMTIETVFDLASLTKPLATTLAVMHLVQQDAVDLDRPLAEQWPALGDARHSITVRKLLAHASGLPAWRPYYMRLQHFPIHERQGLMRRWLLAEPLQAGSDPVAVYSDLGFLLLQWLVEDITGLRMDRFIDRFVYGPMGLRGLFFNDLQQPRSGGPFAATELCPWRNRLLTGEVHDDNAHVLGGVAGHAGLFGTAAAVGELLLALQSAEREPVADSPFSSRSIAAFFQHQPGSTWALGFDTPAPVDSSAGRLFSPGSVGHLGYTGASFWMDRRVGIIVVLLTNRVHPTRYNGRIKGFRPRLHDEVMMALMNQVASRG